MIRHIFQKDKKTIEIHPIIDPKTKQGNGNYEMDVDGEVYIPLTENDISELIEYLKLYVHEKLL